MSNENEFLKMALEYVDYGFYVFPLQPASKKPLTKNGFKDASNDKEEIKAWWKKYPKANIGIATGEISGLLVVDIDGDYPSEWPPLDKTVCVKTGKGWHYYYRHPEEKCIKSRARIGGYDVDVRANGGYVVAPPSIHPEGGRYEFINE